MVIADQSDVVGWLASPAAHGGAAVERIDTHAAVVFLAGTRAWKLKRAVRYDYLDFSTVERRRQMCDAEVALNRRTAPSLYDGVVAITREADGRLAFAGAGEPVDWLVAMRRFDQEQLFDRLAARDALPRPLIERLAAAIARFHAAAAVRTDHGGRAAMEWVVRGNAEGFAEFGAGVLDASACARVTDAALAAIARHAARLDTRRATGNVRQCHGDLHLRNIVRLDGEPTLFDGIEFNDELSCIDTFYDLAFLLMDLRQRSLAAHANAVLNRYVLERHDVDGLTLLPLFLSCRAAIRAKTSATAAAVQQDAAARTRLHQRARDYLKAAEAALHSSPPVLIAIGGLSGTGKSTLARALAPDVGAAPGALVLRSDEIRKQLAGVDPLERLGPEGYTPETSALVYKALADRASQVLAAGHSVIVDAVFARADDRRAIEAVAHDRSAPFRGVWLDAPEPLLRARLAARRGDASDADAVVLGRQLAEPTGPIDWRRLDAAQPIAALRGDVALP